MFLIFCPSPFQCPFQHPCSFSQLVCSERYLDVLCADGSGMWQWQMFALWPARRWGSFAWLSPGGQVSDIVPRLMALKAACCLWLHVVQTSSRLPQVESRLSKWVKTKIQNLRFFHMRKTCLLENGKWWCDSRLSLLNYISLLLKVWWVVLFLQLY